MYHTIGLSNNAYKNPPAMSTPPFMYANGFPLSSTAMTDKSDMYVTTSLNVGYGAHIVATIKLKTNAVSGLLENRYAKGAASAKGAALSATT